MQAFYKRKNRYGFISLDLRVLAYVVFFVISTSITIFINNQILDIQRHQIESQASHLLLMTSSRQEIMIDQNKSLLHAMSLTPELKYLKTDVCNKTLSAYLIENPSYLNLGVLNSDGDVICSGLDYAPGTTGKDRPYFIKAMNSGDFSVGEYQIGRITKKQSLNFGYPLKDNTGKSYAVLFSSVGLTWFQDLLNELQLQSGEWKIVIADRNGTILAGYPSDTMQAGSPGIDAALLSAILSNKSNPTFITDSDGIKRMYVYTTLLKSESKPSNYIIVGADIGKVEQSISLIIWSGFIIIIIIFSSIMYLIDQVRFKNREIKENRS